MKMGYRGMARLNFIFAQLLAGAIAIGWILLISLYMRGRTRLGHWPQETLDDPKSLGLGVHYELTGWGLVVVLLGTLALVVPVILAALLGRDLRWRTVALAMFVAAISWSLFRLTPMVLWYLD